MTEAEWLAAREPQAMLSFLGEAGGASDRKERLFACACVRRLWELVGDFRSRAAVQVAELFADGGAGPRQLHQACVAAAAAYTALRDAGHQRDDPVYVASYAAVCAAWPPGMGPTGENVSHFARAAVSGEGPAHAELLRDVIGSPFRPLALDASRVTPTVLSLARAAYDDRLLPSGVLNPQLLSVLADALEDAGAGGELLAHLRSAGPHVRGCWAIDLLLGKE